MVSRRSVGRRGRGRTVSTFDKTGARTNLPPHLPCVPPSIFPPSLLSSHPSSHHPPSPLFPPLLPPRSPPGLQRSEFENKEVTFEFHISREHNLWHYLDFIVHLNTKDTTEFTGPESYVYKMISVSNRRG